MNKPNKYLFILISSLFYIKRGWHSQPIHGQPDVALSEASSQKFAEKTKFHKVLVKKPYPWKEVGPFLLADNPGSL
jgi:hypothetical protein